MIEFDVPAGLGGVLEFLVCPFAETEGPVFGM